MAANFYQSVRIAPNFGTCTLRKDLYLAIHNVCEMLVVIQSKNKVAFKKFGSIPTVSFTFIIFLFLSIFSIIEPRSISLANEIPKLITVQFNETDLSECILNIMFQSKSGTTISIQNGVHRKITKTSVNARWDTVLKEILIENKLKLVKLEGQYVITEIDESYTSEVPRTQLIITPYNISGPVAEQNIACSANNFVTFGHRHSSGSNPYRLIGKCIKLMNFSPIQFLSESEVIGQWKHRGSSGVVYVQDLSDRHQLEEASSLLTESVGVYEYINVMGAKNIIPHLVIR